MDKFEVYRLIQILIHKTGKRYWVGDEWREDPHINAVDMIVEEAEGRFTLYRDKKVIMVITDNEVTRYYDEVLEDGSE